jgi:hypothetical protein
LPGWTEENHKELHCLAQDPNQAHPKYKSEVLPEPVWPRKLFLFPQKEKFEHQAFWLPPLPKGVYCPIVHIILFASHPVCSKNLRKDGQLLFPLRLLSFVVSWVVTNASTLIMKASCSSETTVPQPKKLIAELIQKLQARET